MTEQELEERLGRLEAQQEVVDEWLREMLRKMQQVLGLEAAFERLEAAVRELIDGRKDG
jgi:vacuolar-type H+-ATPase subunit E/Vma4